MSGKIGYRIESNLIRAPKALVDRFRGCPTGNIVDAIDRISAMHFSIKPIDPAFKMAGSALTVKAWPGDNLIVNKAIEMAKPGDVIVIDNGQFEGSSTWGDLTSFMGKNQGIEGMVTNGLVRDIVGIKEAGVPVFARGSSPNSVFKRGPGEIGITIACGGISVKTGDIIVGDCDGVVVIPLEVAEVVAERTAVVIENENRMMEKIKQGMIAPANLMQSLKEAGYELD